MADNSKIEWTDAQGGVRGVRARVEKTAAARCGVSVEEYRQRVADGLKRCGVCREWKSAAEAFAADASRGDGRKARCRHCDSEVSRASYVPVPLDQRRAPGPSRIPRRAGDKVQARRRINHDVEHGRRPSPNDLHCAYCGHKGSDRAHQYHHHMGYEAEHHYDVVPACTPCHRRNEVTGYE